MANQRVFQVQSLLSNTIEIGGLASLEFNADYVDQVESGEDVAFGVEDVDVGGLRVAVSMQCSDVAKVNTLLAATPGTTTFSGKESAAITYSDYTVSTILWSGMSMSLAKNADGRLSVDGVVRAANATDTLAQIVALAAAQTAPDKYLPASFYRPHTASFTPDGGEAITPLHTESVDLSVSAQIIEDYADQDVAHTAVDILPWRPLQVTLVHRDAVAVAPGHVSAALLHAVKGALTVQLLGRGGAADKALTVKNLKWKTVRERHGRNYTDYTLAGVAGWTKRETPADVQYDLTGANKLFAIA